MKSFIFPFTNILDFEFIVCFINFAKSNTFIFCFELGPKFQGPTYFFPFLEKSLSAKIKYPINGSITCCQGLFASGLRKINVLFCENDSKESFTILSFVQSPPPKQFPALTVAMLHLVFEKKICCNCEQ